MNESHPWGDFSNLGGENRKGGWGERWQKFTVFGYELILDILELQMKTKKKVLSVYISNFGIDTRYFELQMKIKTQKSLKEQLP